MRSTGVEELPEAGHAAAHAGMCNACAPQGAGMCPLRLQGGNIVKRREGNAARRRAPGLFVHVLHEHFFRGEEQAVIDRSHYGDGNEYLKFVHGFPEKL
jgi:hypothetical protein